MPSINPFGADLPIVDTTAVVKGSADATKLVRIEVDGLTTATTRVLTMADQDIDLTPDTGTFAAAGAGGAGLVFLSSVVASASATVDLETTFDSTFDVYMIIATDVVFATDSTDILCRLKLGGSYDAGSNYRFHTHRMKSAGATYEASFSGAFESLLLGTTVSNAADQSIQFSMTVSGVAGTSLRKKVDWKGIYGGTVNASTPFTGGGDNSATTALTGVRFFASSGNITSGTFRLYGITNS